MHQTKEHFKKPLKVYYKLVTFVTFTWSLGHMFTKCCIKRSILNQIAWIFFWIAKHTSASCSWNFKASSQRSKGHKKIFLKKMSVFHKTCKFIKKLIAPQKRGPKKTPRNCTEGTCLLWPLHGSKVMCLVNDAQNPYFSTELAESFFQ